MSRLARIAFASALLTLLVVLTGCGAPAPTAPQISATATAEPVLTRDNAMSTEPGTRWTYTAIGSKGLSVRFPLTGPWNLVPDASVNATEFSNEILAVADAPEGSKFPDAQYAVKSTDEGTGDVLYLFRSLGETSTLGYGRAAKGEDGTWLAEVYDPPTSTYPFGMKVGDTVTVREGEQFDIVATAISESSAKTPAGEFKRALLVRFDFPTPDGKTAGDSVYWILAPGVEWVAYIVPGKQLKPTEPISDIIQIDIITSMPAK